mmetsp:Transcript_30681/g.80189  ORF Transcript_30681/g.80189 Transcript_30681/m.80189 type:complete len:87 (-) Transcript_30681:63-323(-)
MQSEKKENNRNKVKRKKGTRRGTDRYGSAQLRGGGWAGRGGDKTHTGLQQSRQSHLLPHTDMQRKRERIKQEKKNNKYNAGSRCTR